MAACSNTDETHFTVGNFTVGNFSFNAIIVSLCPPNAATRNASTFPYADFGHIELKNSKLSIFFPIDNRKIVTIVGGVRFYRSGILPEINNIVHKFFFIVHNIFLNQYIIYRIATVHHIY